MGDGISTIESSGIHPIQINNNESTELATGIDEFPTLSLGTVLSARSLGVPDRDLLHTRRL